MTKRDEIQKDALTVALNHKNCGLAISMGVGKTLIGLKYIEKHSLGEKDKLRVLIVAPKLSIFETWNDEAKKHNIDITGVDFTTYLSINKKDPNNYDVVVLDECHNLLFSHVGFLGHYQGKILGLTGTPPRYANSEKGKMVNQYCPILFKYITDDAVDDSILNNYRIIVHRLDLSFKSTIKISTKNKSFYTSEMKNYEYWTNRVDESTTPKQKQISSIMRMRALMDYTTKEVYAKTLLNEIEDKCIVFCNTQAQADRVCKHSIHSENPDADENLVKFKNDEITKASCVLQLNEGVNIPNLRAGIIMHAYGNERKSTQRIGRLLRLNPDETAIVHILCYKNTIDEHWIKQALKDLDNNKIKYFDVT